MSGEMVTLLLGAQGGDEESFACLYALTNPILVRYLRVVSDGDPDALALTTWATLLEDLAVSVAAEDDDWLELAVGTARQHAVASDLHRSDASPAPAAPTVPADIASDASGDGADADPVALAAAAIRACGPAVAEVLAMGAAAGLGRDSIARLTGSGPADVLTLVLEGQTRLTMPLESLVATMRLPGTAAEVGDLPAVLTLFAAQARRPRRALALAASTTPATAAGAGAGAAELPGWDSIAPAVSPDLPHAEARRSASARWAARGVGAAAWTLAVGGVAAAVAMIGVVPAAVHALFGDGGNRATVTAHGPALPGGAPAHPGRGTGGPGVPPRGTSTPTVPRGSVVLAGGTAGTGPSSQGVAIALSAPGSGGSGTVVVNAVLADFSPPALSAPTAPTAATAPSGASTTPPASTAPTPTSGSGTTTAASRTAGQGHVKHTTKVAKARGKVARAKVTKTKAKVSAHAHAHATTTRG